MIEQDIQENKRKNGCLDSQTVNMSAKYALCLEFKSESGTFQHKIWTEYMGCWQWLSMEETPSLLLAGQLDMLVN